MRFSISGFGSDIRIELQAMGYEDHCKQINSNPLSKDYVAKVLVKVFQGATR